MNNINSPNIFLIVLDTLREDYATPIIKELSRFGFITYQNTIATAPWTTPSHASMVTGLYPAFHGAHETKEKKDIRIKLEKHEFSFVNTLSDKGYKSFLLSPNIYVSPYFGFRGFNKFIDTSIPRILNEKDVEEFSKIIYKTNTKILPTIKAVLKEKHPRLFFKVFAGYSLKRLRWPKDKGAINTVHHLKDLLAVNSQETPLFVMINLLEVHEPYVKGENVSKLRESNRKGHVPSDRVTRRWQRRYPEQVEYLKDKLIEIMKLLEEFGLFDDSLIIVTSDHGQMLGEHGIIGHGTYLYDELLRVPLAIKYPENRKVIINEQEDTDYISLTKIKPLVIQAVHNDTIDDSILYSPTVFAESYGIPERIRPTNREEQEYVNSLEKYRIAVYTRGEKAIFNVTDWKFEHPKGLSNPEIKRSVIKFLEAVVSSRRLKSTTG
ncbi:sulfatase-like hydrolase/transferase [Thermococcus indicus]|nr:sulfatase-like hydrolase/transferase [Thermococcus indicus]